MEGSCARPLCWGFLAHKLGDLSLPSLWLGLGGRRSTRPPASASWPAGLAGQGLVSLTSQSGGLGLLVPSLPPLHGHHGAKEAQRPLCGGAARALGAHSGAGLHHQCSQAGDSARLACVAASFGGRWQLVFPWLKRASQPSCLCLKQGLAGLGASFLQSRCSAAAASLVLRPCLSALLDLAAGPGSSFCSAPCK